ncbi:WD40-repeat-containing domain protein [Myxozyma melibiosi]|uniref:WD40-repeat-containing domain protein n=1 Tax=Myxozyma melibiosi TaxID=54550 RepID=A0ABR1FFY6_9ASCO
MLPGTPSDVSSGKKRSSASRRSFSQTTLFSSRPSSSRSTKQQQFLSSPPLQDITQSPSLNSAFYSTFPSCSTSQAASNRPSSIGLSTPDSSPCPKRIKSSSYHDPTPARHASPRQSLISSLRQEEPLRLPRRLFMRELACDRRSSAAAFYSRADFNRFELRNFMSTAEDVYSIGNTRMRVLANDLQSIPFSVTSCARHPISVVGDEGGLVHMLDTENRTIKSPLVTLACHESAIFDLAFSPDDVLLGTASGDQTARIFDVQKQICTDILYPDGTHSLKQIRFCPTNNDVLIASTRGGTIALFDRRTATTIGRSHDGISRRIPCGLLARAQNPEKGRRAKNSHARSVTSVEFLDDYSIVSAGEESSALRVWDIRKLDLTKRYLQPVMESPNTTNSRYGVTSLGIDRANARIWALGRDNCLYAYPLLDGPRITQPLEILRHEKLKVDSFYVKLSVLSDPAAIAAGNLSSGYVACGSSTNSVVVFPSSSRGVGGGIANMRQDGESTRKAGTALVHGHTAEITGLSWNSNGALMSISDDRTSRRWTFNRDGAAVDEIRQRWKPYEDEQFVWNREGYAEA